LVVPDLLEFFSIILTDRLLLPTRTLGSCFLNCGP
jgi:hypothetical protein